MGVYVDLMAFGLKLRTYLYSDASAMNSGNLRLTGDRSRPWPLETPKRVVRLYVRVSWLRLLFSLMAAIQRRAFRNLNACLKRESR